MGGKEVVQNARNLWRTSWKIGPEQSFPIMSPDLDVEVI